MEMKPLREQQAEAWFQVADALDSVQPGWLEAFSEKSGGECAVECIQSMHARITELESRLEIDERHPIDGIAARDATIKYQDQRIAELEKDCCQLIDERDERDEVIDALMAEVLGGDCKEWSSAYGFNDAVVDVECRMKELEKDAARLDWMQENFICADFRYGEPATEVIVIEIPRGARVCGDLRVDIDTAMKGD